MFLEMDNELFKECEQQYLEKEANAKVLEEQRELTWKRLEAVAAKGGSDDMVMVNQVSFGISYFLFAIEYVIMTIKGGTELLFINFIIGNDCWQIMDTIKGGNELL